MKAEDVRAKTDSQLQDELLKLRKEAFNLRFQAASGQLQDSSRRRTVRRTIAQVKTILNERRRAAAKAAADKASA